jgi:hypothetical protein
MEQGFPLTEKYLYYRKYFNSQLKQGEEAYSRWQRRKSYATATVGSCSFHCKLKRGSVEVSFGSSFSCLLRNRSTSLWS